MGQDFKKKVNDQKFLLDFYEHIQMDGVAYSYEGFPLRRGDAVRMSNTGRPLCLDRVLSLIDRSPGDAAVEVLSSILASRIRPHVFAATIAQQEISTGVTEPVLIWGVA